MEEEDYSDLDDEDKSWFRRHWILTTVIVLFVLGIIGIFTSNQNSTATGNVVNNNNVQATAPSNSAVEKCTGKTFESLCIQKKLTQCSELWAGEEVKIPAMKDEGYTACHQEYYLGGEDELDNYILELKNNTKN